MVSRSKHGHFFPTICLLSLPVVIHKSSKLPDHHHFNLSHCWARRSSQRLLYIEGGEQMPLASLYLHRAGTKRVILSFSRLNESLPSTVMWHRLEVSSMASKTKLSMLLKHARLCQQAWVPRWKHPSHI